jgi:hypothetical protein
MLPADVCMCAYFLLGVCVSGTATRSEPADVVLFTPNILFPCILICSVPCLQPSTVQGQIMGSLTLPSSNGKKWDACLELISNGAQPQGEPVFSNFYNLRMRRLGEGENLDVLQQPGDDGEFLLGDANMRLAEGQHVPSSVAAASHSVPVAVPAPSIDLQGHASWLAKGVQEEMQQDGYHNVTSLLRNKYRW